MYETYLFCELGNDRQRWIVAVGDVSPVRVAGGGEVEAVCSS
jgi:hypothetical protein